MKNKILAGAIALFSIALGSIMSRAYAAVPSEMDADGCYQMYRGTHVYPAVCIRGSQRKAGPLAAKVLFAIPDQSAEVVWCAKTTSMRLDVLPASKNEAIQDRQTWMTFGQGTDQFVITLVGQPVAGVDQGRVTLIQFGKTTLLAYTKLGRGKTAALFERFDSHKCPKSK